MPEIKRSCASCTHAQKTRPEPTSVETVLQCFGAPPAAIAIPATTPMGLQMQVMSVWPVVKPAWCCGQWAPAQEVMPPAVLYRSDGKH